MSAPDKAAAPCPYCSADVWVGDDVMVGAIIVCDECATPLEVISVDPLMLDYAWEEELDEELDEQLEDEEDFAFLDDELEGDETQDEF